METSRALKTPWFQLPTMDRQASFLTYKVVSLSGIAYKVQTEKKQNLACLRVKLHIATKILM